MDRRSSLQNRVESYWLPEIKHHCPGVPYIFVCLKSDLRAGEEEERRKQGKEIEERKRVITKEEAEATLAKLEGKALVHVRASTSSSAPWSLS